jgi:hypothetical protein
MSKNAVEPERSKKIWRMRVAFRISKATRVQAQATGLHQHTRVLTHTSMYYLLLFHDNDFVNVPHYYVICIYIHVYIYIYIYIASLM